MRRTTGPGGFTLVEVIVTLSLLEIMLLATMVTLHRAAAATARATLIERAVWEATAIAGRVDPAGSGEAPYIWGRVAWSSGLLTAEDSAGTVLLRLELPRP